MATSAARTALVRNQGRGSSLLQYISNHATATATATTFQTSQRRTITKMVRVILKEDMPNGKNYAGEVVNVKAGYARNLLIPRKIALYAVPSNFERMGMKDPGVETAEEKRARMEQEKLAEEDGGGAKKEADILRNYLRNKVLTIWRKIDPNTDQMHPGRVTAGNVREKLGIQLKIDLGEDELVHLRETPVVGHDELGDEEVDKIINEITTEEACTVSIRQLGIFVAKISLAGGYVVPLKVSVLKR